ncbi:LamG domain-containing protein [Modestobacter sp. VKM Ac-2986]|uniref:LamG domain-containing protein n=1 Tax=Modestobacter sp. VKM Ac-2986 TaxID=3004140 RepID=UPI0022ABBAD0|nr:LamG domain-containing protein [Modestobacter sp. VKM Ac-2986]MCZ2830556.1 LamG domain-containing protein [Modestobacter sp. VKM Ac-2986]
MSAPQADGPSAGHGVRDSWVAAAVTPLARGALTLLVGLLMWAQLPVLLGWETTVVMSGSMAPAVVTGDVVVVRPLPGSPEVGRVLLVDDPDRPGTARLHRLTAVEDGGLRLQGDANADPDSSLVAPSAVHGAGVLRVPFVGLPVVWAAGQRWLPLALTAGALVALVAAAGWYRPAGTATAGRTRRLLGRGRHAVPGTPRAVQVRRAAAVGVLVVGCPLLLQQPTPAQATYSTTSANTANSVTMDEVLAWGCVHETATVAATRFWSLRETTGTTFYNTGTVAVPTAQFKGNARLRGGVTQGAVGPDCGRGATGAVTLDGSSGWISTNLSAPASDDMTTQVWFRTTVRGGVLFGLNNLEVDTGQHDRHVYMTDDGQLAFGVYSGGTHTVVSPLGKDYADGVWHLATATLGATGMRLFVDGAQVAADATQKVGEPMDHATWRFGWTALGNWTKKPTNTYFTGDLASAAVFGRALTAAEVAEQYLLRR